MVRISRASRRRAERERKKREKARVKDASRELKQSKTQSVKAIEQPETRSVPWDEKSPKCPNCSSDWIDEGDMYSCHKCGRFSMKTDLGITDCERCNRPFLWEALESWTDFPDNDDDDDEEEHLLCSECLTAVWAHGDVEWLKKRAK